MSVRDAIKSLGMTQQEFANECGSGLRSVQRWSNTNRLPKHANIKLMHLLAKKTLGLEEAECLNHDD